MFSLSLVKRNQPDKSKLRHVLQNNKVTVLDSSNKKKRYYRHNLENLNMDYLPDNALNQFNFLSVIA